MEIQLLLEKVINTLSDYYEKQDSFKNVFQHEPIMSKAIEVFDEEMLNMIDIVLELIGIPNEESSEKYSRENWTKSVCSNLIKIAAQDKKFIVPAAELISNWKCLSDYTSKIETHTWFYYTQLLEEHITGYKKWHENQQKKEKEKGKNKTKTA
ncbi:hypothetical protein AM500_18625 [Bacillus sp. FJAT-18017]|uniref:hypothetical protein n=1 Tax=Bacillus sp. FJAT-18017 TaxID=1705566 RepID=UPI0006AF3C03|nr:hypothetical protein [Bacillus sp. FJAT-18017]ALC91575.1 hypothetical protein AM500_18625 [Bacillus sp. FJAT-18017]